MKKSAEEILKDIRKRFKEERDSNMRILNADRLYAEVAKCIQPIKDKRANICKLNTVRGNHGHCREGFPLQYEEISDFCSHIDRGLHNLERIFVDLKYFSPPSENLWKSDEIKLLMIQQESDLTKDEENEIDSFIIALRFILIKRGDMDSTFGRKVSGLKKRIKNLQRIIAEEKMYEEQTVTKPWRLDRLTQGAAAALSFNKENAGAGVAA